MIAEAAHFRAQKRSLPEQSDALADWLAAEAEIDAMIAMMLADLISRE